MQDRYLGASQSHAVLATYLGPSGEILSYVKHREAEAAGVAFQPMRVRFPVCSDGQG